MLGRRATGKAHRWKPVMKPSAAYDVTEPTPRGAQRARSAIILSLAGCLLVPPITDLAAYGFRLRTLQRGAESFAIRRISASLGLQTELPNRPAPPDLRMTIDHPPRDGVYAGDERVLRLTLSRPWQSPFFKFRRILRVSATVMLMPVDQPGEARIVVVE